jgi:hypothetical protein
MTYQVYKSTNKGRSWALQGTTDIIPLATFFPGQENFSFAYSQFKVGPSGLEFIDGFFTGIGTGGGFLDSGVFTIEITAPDDPEGTQATATPVMAPAPPGPDAGKFFLQSVTITEAGSGYTTSPTVTFLRNGVSVTTLTSSLDYRSKYITYSLSGITWTQAIVTPIGEEEPYVGIPTARYDSVYFVTLIDTGDSTVDIYAGVNPQALVATSIPSGTGTSRISQINDAVYTAIDNSLYTFNGSTWSLVGNLYDETTSDNLYPNYLLKSWVTTSQGIYAYITDSTNTTAYIYQTEDLLNYTRVQTVGSVATYPLANQGTYLYTDNSAAFTATNNLLELQ